jgi:replication factor C subunit 3/5
LLLSGPPGTGKTSIIMSCAKELYGNNYPLMVLDINASEERGIDIVRNKIKNFVTAKPVFVGENDAKFKLVILDEADAMTSEAQSMLVHIIQSYMHNARFCLICNYIKKIDHRIISRCVAFKFSPLKHASIKTKINEIVSNIKFEITNDGVDALIKIANGDMRIVINTLQATHMAFDKVNNANISKCTGYPTDEDIDKINNILIKKNIKDAYYDINKIIRLNGYSLINIINELFNVYIGQYFTNNTNNIDVVKLILNLRTIETNLAMCQNENIQLAGLISAFCLSLFQSKNSV